MPRRRAALTRRDICPFDKTCDHLLVIDKDQLNRFGRKKPKIVGSIVFFAGIPPDAAKAFTAKRNSISLHCWPAIPASAFWNLAALASIRDTGRELLWRGLWVYAQHHRIDVLFGCASLPGVDPLALALPLSFLHRHALADAERLHDLAVRRLGRRYLNYYGGPMEMPDSYVA